MDDSEDFRQLRLRFIDPIQHDYEVIRPIVLFATPVAERSRRLKHLHHACQMHPGAGRQVRVERTTVREKARRFVQEGMLGLVDKRAAHAGRKDHVFPKPVARYILYLKQLYPPIHYREIVRILKRKYGYQTNHHTVKHFLDSHPFPIQLDLNLPTYHEFEDAYQARWKVVRLFYEGWHRTSIAGLLKLSERHVRRILEAFEQDNFAGLED